MPIIPIESVGSIGLVTDQTASELPANAWSSVENMRFRRNMAERSSGFSEVTTPTVDPYWLMYWEQNTAPYWFYANETAIYRTDGSTHLDVTRASGAYSAGQYPSWNGGVLGGVPIVNNAAGTDVPQEWDNATSKFKDLSNWPSTLRAKCVRPYLNYLIALNVTDNGTNYPTTLWWSHPADPGSVPPDWDVTSTTSDAGSYPISGTTGFVVDCLPLSGINVVYKTDSTWFMRPAGKTFIFQTGPLFRGKGILARDCVVEFEKKHFVVGVSDVWIHDGNTPKSIIEGRVKDRFYSALDPDNFANTYVFSDPNRQEIWICFPTTGNDVPNRALIWNWVFGTWTEQELANGWAFAQHGVVNTSASNDIFNDGTTIQFDSDNSQFDVLGYNPTTFRTLIGRVGAGRQLYLNDETETFAGQAFNSTLERTGLALIGQGPNGPIVDQTVMKFCRAVYPDIYIPGGQGSIEVYVGSQNSPSDTVTWSGPHTFNPLTDVKVDCTVSGRYLGVKFSSTQDFHWECGGYKLDLEGGGKF